MTGRMIIAAGVLSTLIACGSGEGTEPNVGAVPVSVMDAESQAEDVQGDIDTLAWASAAARVAGLRSLSAGVVAAIMDTGREPGAGESGGSETDPDSDAAEAANVQVRLDSLDATVARQDRAAALQAANALSRALVVVTEDYALRVPAAVIYMDVAGRDLVYAAERVDWVTAASAATELQARYATVQSTIGQRNAALDAKVRGELTTIDAAVTAQDSAAAHATGLALLEDVDALELLY
jgi:hypothetical protein